MEGKEKSWRVRSEVSKQKLHWIKLTNKKELIQGYCSKGEGLE